MSQPDHKYIDDICQYLSSHALQCQIKKINHELQSQVSNWSCGVLLISFDHRYAIYGLSLAKQLSRNFGVSVCIVTNLETLNCEKLKEEFSIDGISIVSSPSYLDRCFKINANKISPYKKTFFFDSDMVVINQNPDFFSYLVRADIALVCQHDGLSSNYPEFIKKICNGTNVFESFDDGSLCVDGGLFGWVDSKISRKFFVLWREAYLKNMVMNKLTGDQLPLNAARSLFPGRIELMPPVWNYREHLRDVKRQRIFHYNSGRLAKSWALKIFVLKHLVADKKWIAYLSVCGVSRGLVLFRGLVRILQRTIFN